ncbi:MAG: hypothetical protein E7538_05755 [Ruminococcaceae bacterium]|nr:hypothetical protein [Oscillospiraceae bacterium]
MDTKLKKFNSTLILKVLAVMLCLTSVANCVSKGIEAIYTVDAAGIRDCSYEDAFYRAFVKDRSVTETETFKYHVGRYSDGLANMIGHFGNGSEEAYEQWKNSISQSNTEYYKRAKENLIKNIISDEFIFYLRLVESGVVEPLGLLTTAEYSGNTIDIYEDNISSVGLDYAEICNNSSDNVVKYPRDESLKKKAQELGADGVFELNNYYQILEDDWSDEPEEIILESYKPGLYAFKIDDTALKKELSDRHLFVTDSYGSAEAFAAEYKKYADTVKQEYPSGRYFIRDTSGKVYTNVKGLGKKSTDEEVEKKFAAFGFYCREREYGEIYLSDGRLYTHGGFNGGTAGEYESGVIMATTAVAETTADDSTEVTVPVTQASTVYVDAYSSTPFVDEEGGGWLCLIGVDMSPDAYSENDLFLTTELQIKEAQDIIESVAMVAGVMGTIFLVCFIYLIVRSGRRRGDKSIYLMKADAMFTDWRIALDVLLGWGVSGLFVVACDEFADDYHKTFITVSSLLSVAFTALVLDLVLFIVRHIKARTLFKRLSPVWLIIKCLGLYKDKLSPVINEKLLYTREFARGTLIRAGLVAAVNAVLIFFGVIEAVDNYTCFILVLCVLFDIGVLVWVIRILGGLHKIFSLLEEIRQGNYDVYINTYALPKTLRESAEKVMSLRDGLKSAVEEAVKQEQTKTELITNVSHDLKTPLTSIINYVELLKKCEINDADAKEYLDVLGEKSDRLKKLIEDLVEASKASTGNIKTEIVEVGLNEMVSQLLGEHADGLEKKRLSVVAEFPENELTVRADGKLLYRVLENLIVNVEKYSLYGTRVYVTVKNEGAYGTVTLKNISEQPLNITADQLKERFVRGDESRSTEGNGLGLSIAQSLCDVQGGELEISINGDLFTATVRLKK